MDALQDNKSISVRMSVWLFVSAARKYFCNFWKSQIAKILHLEIKSKKNSKLQKKNKYFQNFKLNTSSKKL